MIQFPMLITMYQLCLQHDRVAGEAGAAEAVRCALQRCPGWELVIAKCAAHEPELRATQFNEVMPLSWPCGQF